MIVATCKETFPGERRVALAPSVVAALEKRGFEVLIESGAGQAAGFPDEQYRLRGAKVIDARADVLNTADILVQVRLLGANGEHDGADLEGLRSGQVVIAMCDPLGAPERFRDAAAKNISLLALELIPRITRAQAMDVLSSMATIAGYRAVLAGAMELPKMFPMITYAAGMLKPARVFVIGAGVAGLRAIATAKAMGALVQGHDIRPGSADEVKSVGAKFVELKIAGDTQDAGGYAKKLTEEDYQRQRELIAEVCRDSDLVITTAAIPGRKSPLLITADAAGGMAPGSVIVDLAAERGGNCALTEADQRVVKHGVTILGPTNLPSDVPAHASEMFANNVAKLLLHICKDGKLHLDTADEITAGTLVTLGGQIVHERIRQMLDMPPLRQHEQTDEAPSNEVRDDSGEDESADSNREVASGDEHGDAEDGDAERHEDTSKEES